MVKKYCTEEIAVHYREVRSVNSKAGYSENAMWILQKLDLAVQERCLIPTGDHCRCKKVLYPRWSCGKLLLCSLLAKQELVPLFLVQVCWLALEFRVRTPELE